MTAIEYLSHSADDTERLGEQLGRLLNRGAIVCLYGDLGSGKTVFAKGLARGLGVPPEVVVRSPSFVLMQRYSGSLPLYHVDLYRLNSAMEADDIGLRDILGAEGVAVIEWADKLDALLPDERLDVTIDYREPEKRLIILEAKGTAYQLLLQHWTSQLGTSSPSRISGTMQS